MVTPDPVDLRLLTLLAEMGRAAVHEVAARLGMDPREAASRLVALSANGLPLVVGVECDPNGIRGVLAAAAPPGHPQQAPHPVQGTPSGVYPASAYPQSAPQPTAYPAQSGHGYPMGPPSGANAYPTGYPQQQAPHPVQGTPSGVYPATGTPSGPYPAAGTPSGAYPPPQIQSGPYPAQQQSTPSGAYQVQQQSTPSGAYQVHGTPSGRYPGPAQAPMQHQAPPPSQPIPAQPPADPVMSTWGPPQSSSWARGDQPGGQGPAHAQQQTTRPVTTRKAKVGEKLETEGLEGELLQIQLVELVDPADFLFTAAGYRLQEGERSVVVHTEMVNKGAVAFNSLPDLYLVLMTKDGQTVSKAPVSLSSRPPHRIGVAPGETAGGHTVYVLPEHTEITAIRWTARPDDTSRALTWDVVL